MPATHSGSEVENVYNATYSSAVPVERWARWNIGRIRLFGVFVHFKYFALLIAEFAVITAAIYYCYSEAALRYPQASGWIVAKSLFGAAPFTLCFAGLGLYSSRQTLSGIGVILRYVVASAIAVTILYIMHSVLHSSVTASDFIIPVGLAIILLASVRSIFGQLLDSNLLKRRVLVIGDGVQATTVEEIANDPNQRGFSLVKVIPDLSIEGALVKTVKQFRINEVVVAFDDRRNTLPAKELLDCRLSGVSVVEVLDFLERETGVIPFEHLQPSWLIFTDGFNQNIFSRLAKRVFDIVAATILISVASPIIAVTCAAIKLDRRSPGDIVYKQKRVGLNGETFDVLKFRSMRSDAEKNGQAQWATENDSRVTSVGSILRKYRIDELPQLFNVLMGSMSLVGPRPERPVFVKQLNELNNLYVERHRAKPGVTGWAQLRFPYTDTEEDSIKKLQYDMYYLKNQGFVFDFYILLQTIEVVLFGKGAR